MANRAEWLRRFAEIARVLERQRFPTEEECRAELLSQVDGDRGLGTFALDLVQEIKIQNFLQVGDIEDPPKISPKSAGPLDSQSTSSRQYIVQSTRQLEVEEIFPSECSQRGLEAPMPGGEILNPRQNPTLAELTGTSKIVEAGRRVAFWFAVCRNPNACSRGFSSKLAVEEWLDSLVCKLSDGSVFMIHYDVPHCIRTFLEQSPLLGPVDNEAPSTLKKKKSTVRGEASVKIAAGLIAHHKYVNGSCLNYEPIHVGSFATLLGVSKGSVSSFLGKTFNPDGDDVRPYVAYRRICQRSQRLISVLQDLNGENFREQRYGRSHDSRERD